MTRFQGPEGQEDMPYLLTVGPVTTSRDVKFAMLADWGARDGEFFALVQKLKRDLKALAGCDDSYDCVFVPGSSLCGIEAALGTFCPSKRKKTLIVSNGRNGSTAVQVMQRMGRNHVHLTGQESRALNPRDVAKALDEDRNITHVWMVHCEASSGVLNPLNDIAREVKSRGRVMMVDAVASFGGLPLNMGVDAIDVVVACPHNCLESVPGFSIVLAKRMLLEAAADESPSLALNLHHYWLEQQAGQHLLSPPPTHALAALAQALRELHVEGGVEGRHQRYRKISDALVTRLKAFGFHLFVSDADRSPIVHTVLSPGDSQFDFKVFSEGLRLRGYAIDEGSLSKQASFVVANMGQCDEKTVTGFMAAVEAVMADMNIGVLAPAGR